MDVSLNQPFLTQEHLSATIQYLLGCQNCLRSVIGSHLNHHGPQCLTPHAHSAVDALGDVKAMQKRLMWAMDELELRLSEKRNWESHLHFATLPLSGLSDVGANFIPYLVHPSTLHLYHKVEVFSLRQC